MVFRDEIPQRAFINAQIIQSADLSEVIRTVSEHYGLKEYNIMNSAYIVSLLYCLIVIPKEAYWKDMDDLEPLLRKLFSIKKCKKDFDKNFTFNLIRAVRNSVAHANFSCDAQMNFTFNDKEPTKEEHHFECTITRENIIEFLSKVGAIAANARPRN
jgi:hypothetical protein